MDLASRRYDLIIGRDLMADIGLNVLANNQTISWDDAAIPWRDIDSTTTDAFFYDGKEMKPHEKDLKRLNNILDAKYKKSDLDTSVETMEHLSFKEKKKLLNLLKKYQTLFDGTLGQWKGSPYKIKTKDGVSPHHARPYSVPKIHELTLKSELERLVKADILRKVNR